MAHPSDEDVSATHRLLEGERQAVVAALAAAGGKAKAIASEQNELRQAVSLLVKRGETVGLSVSEMAKALGYSRHWTAWLRAETRK